MAIMAKYLIRLPSPCKCVQNFKQKRGLKKIINKGIMRQY